MHSVLVPAYGGLILLLALWMGGCAAPGQADLAAGRKALEEGRPDQAIAQADECLRKSPRGTIAAQAWYLRGRAYEQRTAYSTAEASANLQAARTCYSKALACSPDGVLAAYIRTGLGNVAYFQDDYATAIEQLAAASERLDKPELKSWALYRLGVSQQRVGRFIDADRTFAAVQRRFADSVPAQRAREHVGVRSFSLQVAAFGTAPAANKAAQALRREGLVPVRLVDSKGLQILRLGPFTSYAQARAMKARLAGQYPDALILP